MRGAITSPPLYPGTWNPFSDTAGAWPSNSPFKNQFIIEPHSSQFHGSCVFSNSFKEKIIMLESPKEGIGQEKTMGAGSAKAAVEK